MSLKRTNGRQDDEFLADVMSFPAHEGCPKDFLEDKVLPWIREWLELEQIVERDTLCDWAKDQSIEDVCLESDLEAWAEKNGYIKPA